ncbi:hypothetical protein ASG11_02775 [Sphingomonas sp. Leaf357]|nr:hypothetical protein ASG11_02775 [Sphingomonas sp. Leaf357]
MHAAEDLRGQVDPVRPALRHAVQRRPTGAVDAGQAEHTRAERQPRRVRRRPRAAPAADRRALIDPRAARVAIDAGGRQIAEPGVRSGQRLAIGGEGGVRLVGGRDGRQDMRRQREFAGDGVRVAEA